MSNNVTILSNEEIFKKYPKGVTSTEASYARAAAGTDGIDIACVDGLKGSKTILDDMQEALNNHVGKSCRAVIYDITDMTELKENGKVYCAFETKKKEV